MQVLLNTHLHIAGRQAMSDHLESVVEEALGHHGRRITRVEAHVTDPNGVAKGSPNDIHGTLGARPVGREPVVVRDRAAKAHQVIQGALHKLEWALASSSERHEVRHATRTANQKDAFAG